MMTNKHLKECPVIQKVSSTNDLSQKRKNISFLKPEDIVSSSGNIEETLEDFYYVFSSIPGGSFVLEQSLDEDKKSSKHVSTIALKLKKKLYNSLSKLESDLSTAVTSLLNTIQPLDPNYSLISSFYTFSKRLLIQEQKRNVTQTPSNDVKKYTDELFPLRPSGNECLFVIGPNGPLFSSFAMKSVLDTRPINTEGRAYTTQIIPNNSISIKSIHTFGNISPSISSELYALKKRKLKHPTLKHIPCVKWLYYDSYSSYAPTKDMETAIFSEKHFNAVWWRREIEKLSIEKREKMEKTCKDDINQSDNDSSNTLELDEKLIFSYEPMSLLDDLKTSSFTTSKEYNDVNINELGKLIQTLSEMQSSRIAHSQTKTPGKIEEQLAFHIQQLLLKQIITFNIQPSQLLPKPLSLSMSFLVLGPSYNGTLPNLPNISSVDELRSHHGSYNDLQGYNKNDNLPLQIPQRIPNIPIPLPSLMRNDSYRSFSNSFSGYNKKITGRFKRY